MNKLKNFRGNIFILILIILSLFTGNLLFSQEYKVGETFPSWSEGYLDIHHINTGKGESSFFILPDGTTMLVDAGATIIPKPRVTDAKPNDSRTPGEWISRYLLNRMQGLPEKKLNYIISTHFHYDHIGEIRPDTKISKSGTYKLAGITEVGELIPCDKLIDRGWPDYDWPVLPADDYLKNYIQFVKWQVENGGFQAEQFRVGVKDQLILVNDPLKYPDFEIRNIAVNGHIWTGVGSNERNNFPALKDLTEKDYPKENMCSIAFRLSYGKFDYFSGGDIFSVAEEHWQDVETPIALVVGPVEVCKANHHASFDAMGISYLQSLRPRVMIIQTWLAQQPDMAVLRRMLSTRTYPGPRDIFATNIMEETKIVIGSAIDILKSQQGHIVVRVNPGGANYLVYVLDDSTENFKIKVMYGPYNCN